ncbi:MAG TPA: CRISPR-associated RAMP protein Csx7 [Ktedonobacteraceae bacterium]
MLKALVNDACLRINITSKGPLLIKTGYATVIGADMAPVQTYRHGHQEVYLPGSSLKGAFRSHIEKVVNSIKPRVACNPVGRPEDQRDERHLYRPACGNSLKDKMAAQTIYAKSCPTCRLFGSTSYIGRISIEDAYLPAGVYEEKKLIEHRDGIAIDRLTGGTGGGAKFDLETVTSDTTFTTTVRLRNFEIWQLGMLFALIQDLEDDLIPLGSGRSRGLGRVRGEISAEAEGAHPGGLLLSTPRSASREREPARELWGLGRWLAEEGEAEAYGTTSADLLLLDQEMAHRPRGVRQQREFHGAALADLKEQSIEAFVKRMQQWVDAPAALPGRQGV